MRRVVGAVVKRAGCNVRGWTKGARSMWARVTTVGTIDNRARSSERAGCNLRGWTKGARKRRVLAAAVGTVMLLSNCGGVEGEATAEPEPWDPCSIPADAIAATGLDPEIRTAGWSEGIVVPDWSRCVWQGPADDPTYFLGILASPKHTVDEARRNSTYSNTSDVQVGDRTGFRYIGDAHGPNKECSLAIQTVRGIVEFMVYAFGDTPMTADPCEIVLGHGLDLVDSLPAEE